MDQSNLCDVGNPTLQSPLNTASKDKFLLILNLPYVLKKESINDPSIDIDPLQITIHGSVVPTVQVPANEVRYAGQSYNVSSHARPNYGPLNVKFVVDNQFKNYWILWKWLTILNTPRESLYGGGEVPPINWKDRADQGNLIEYQSNFSVVGLNEYNRPGIEFIYYNAFPVALGGIEYSYRDTSLIESSVEFQFSQLDVKRIL